MNGYVFGPDFIKSATAHNINFSNEWSICMRRIRKIFRN